MTVWRLVALVVGIGLMGLSSTLIARRRRSQRIVLTVAVISWAVGFWAAFSSATAMLA